MDTLRIFFCHEAKLIIELDGSQHYAPEGKEKDCARTVYFHSLGIKVLRFSNADVDAKFERVCQAVLLALEQCAGVAEVVIEDSPADPSVTAMP